MMGERTLLDDFTYRYRTLLSLSSFLHVCVCMCVCVCVHMFVFACETLHSRPNTFSFFKSLFKNSYITFPSISSPYPYSFRQRDRIGVVGPNGVGKSTFLKVLTGSLELAAGSVRLGDTVRIGYYEQVSISYTSHTIIGLSTYVSAVCLRICLYTYIRSHLSFLCSSKHLPALFTLSLLLSHPPLYSFLSTVS
jgi:ABC transporter